MASSLLADRFLRVGNDEIIDLALGGSVSFREAACGTPDAQRGWVEACTARFSETTDNGENLVDYGLVGPYGRFEAWRVPSGSARGPGSARKRGWARGLEVDALVSSIVELLDIGRFGEPRSVTLSLPSPPLRAAVLRVVARESRLRGFVPVSVRTFETLAADQPACATALLDLITSRHVMIIHVIEEPRVYGVRRLALRPAVGRQSARGSSPALARLTVALGTASARPHLVLVVSAGDDVFDGAFSGSAPKACVRERPGRYDVTSPSPCEPTAPLPALVSPPAWTCARESPAVRRAVARAHEALALSARGRHAAGERLLREAAGTLARRGDHAGAGHVTLNLGRLLLHRGRASDAIRSFETARDALQRGKDSRGSVHAAAWLGLAWTDEGRLIEGEAALRSALIAADQIGDAGASRLARLGLVRCLYWQRRYEDAHLHLSAVPWLPAPASENRPAAVACVRESAPEPPTSVSNLPTYDEVNEPAGCRIARLHFEPSPGVAAECLAARVALARRDLPLAGARASAALRLARAVGSDVDACAAHAALAALHVEIGDLDALRDHVTAGLRHARRGHAPTRALRLRLSLLDGLRRSGRGSEARVVRNRLARLRLERLPVLLRGRVEAALHEDGTTRSRVVVPAGETRDGVATIRDDHAVGVWRDAELALSPLRICQEEPDDRRAIERVCRLLRDRLRAVAICCYGVDGQTLPVLGACGARGASEELARRAIDTGLPVATRKAASGYEAAVAIRYAGASIGALVARWPVDAILEPAWCDALLDAAASAMSPAAHAALDRLAGPPPADPGAAPALIGVSDGMDQLRRAIARTALVPFPVLIEGESGSGKELVARAIHRESPRRHRRFCALNCAAMPDELIEAEMFGHARGAFTGAVAERIGLFEEADHGTLLLDEVGDLSPRAQAKLLRVVQEEEIRRVGENCARRVDVRLVAATNRPLEGEVRASRFRRDLLYRLDVIRIRVPPLRDRVEDIAPLALHYWGVAAARAGSRAALSSAALAALARYDWPGNIRELQNVLAALVVGTPRRGSVGPSALPAVIARSSDTAGYRKLDEARRLFEQRFVRAALARAGGHRGRAAQELGLSRQGLAKLIARLGVDGADATAS